MAMRTTQAQTGHSFVRPALLYRQPLLAVQPSSFEWSSPRRTVVHCNKLSCLQLPAFVTSVPPGVATGASPFNEPINEHGL